MPEPADASSRERGVTELLAGLREGRERDREALFELVYGELRVIARNRMARVPPGDTLQATALVHEAAVRMLGREGDAQDRRHFFALAARAMRDVLVEQARRHAAAKRGGEWRRVTMSAAFLGRGEDKLDLIEVQGALEDYSRTDPVGARLVELKIFGGLSIDDVAAELGLSASSIDRRWKYARAWLGRRLSP